jgi:hypothetical protein
MRTILCAIAAVLFLLAAVSPTLITRAEIWGLFCLALGFALEGYKFGGDSVGLRGRSRAG